jgi:anti-sigma-K factor RskA
MTDDRDLEAALGRVLTAEEPEAESVARIARRFESALPPQKRASAWWPAALTDWNFAPAWPRIAALACAAVLGITVGLSSFGTRLAADLDLVQVASSDDGGGNAFDVDAVTGIRP